MNDKIITICKKGIIVGGALYVGLALIDAMHRSAIRRKVYKIENMYLDLQEEMIKSNHKKKRRLFR